MSKYIQKSIQELEDNILNAESQEFYLGLKISVWKDEKRRLEDELKKLQEKRTGV